MAYSKISIVIPNYNYAKYLQNAIDSVLAQTYKNTEIIVVDDGSNDDSHNILISYGNKIVIIRQKNQGVSVARNNGVLKSTGEYVAFLDADDLWLPQKLEKQLTLLRSDEMIGLVHCSMMHISPQNALCGENIDGMEGYVAADLLRFERGVVIGAGSTSLVLRNAFDEVGGFKSNLSTAADWDFCYRIALKYKIGFVREPLVLYRIHGNNMHDNVKVMEHDMMVGFKSAFSNGALANRWVCYGNLHRVLAGSYFNSKQYCSFLYHMLLSLLLMPFCIVYYFKAVFRRIKILPFKFF